MVIAVVAIPAPDDRVWKLSSEKVPHVTLLALSDNLANVAHVSEFIQHAVKTTLRPFSMVTDRRGVLGDKSADVLFFKKRYSEQLNGFRDNLLTDPDISTAYNSITQFPQWIPHLTLGFPETPAKKNVDGIAMEYGSVMFDRIALWTGDYEGVEFPLTNDDQDELSQAERGRAFIAHYGVKGMHWGQRKSEAEAAKAQGASDRNDAKLKTINEKDRRARVSDKVKQKQLVDLKPSNDHRSAAFVRTKAKVSGVETLTNQDLQTVITRMNLEMQYSTLKKAEHEQSFVGAGKKWAADFATDVAKDTAASWLKRPGSGSSSSDRGPIKVKAWTTGQQFGDQIESNRRKAIGS